MNVTKITEKYVAEHPAIMDCLKIGLINYSELSRQICAEHGIKKFQASLIACRRYYLKIRSQELHEKEIIRLIRGAKLKIRNKIIVAIIDKPREMEPIYSLQRAIKKKRGDFNMIEGEDTVTIVTNSENAEDVKMKFNLRLIKLSSGLVQITMVFDRKIETTSGVVSYIYSLLSDNGINILEEMSCWTDIMVIIDENDLARAMKVLSA